MAIVNENQEMVHYLCKHGANIHERAYGAFLMPEDQRKSRKDNFTQEEIVLSDVTNYERWASVTEQSLLLASSLKLKVCIIIMPICIIHSKYYLVYLDWVKTLARCKRLPNKLTSLTQYYFCYYCV